MRRRVSKKEVSSSPDASKEDENLFEEEDDGVSSFDDDDQPVSQKNARMSALAAVAGEFKSFRPASQVLTRVRAVPTIWPAFDYATKVGGLPIERFSLLHGPSASGKTYLTIGLLLSFLMRDHFGVLIDAERTTPISWLEKAMGRYATHPGFFADRPKTYEATVAAVRAFVNTLRKLRDSGKVPENTSALIVVDSIRKLVPEDQFKRIMKDAKAAGDKKEKLKDRSAQIKAAMNAAWMDELIPLLEETQSAMVVIARETEDPDADARSKMFGTNYKVGGGKALYYDASMNMRVERLKAYGKKIKDGDKERLVPYGDLHQVTITKSKVSGKGEDLKTKSLFHISNGVLVPEGFDRARDVLEIAQRFAVVEGTSWLKYGRNKWQGEHAAVKKLSESPKLLDQLEKDCRALFSTLNKDYLEQEEV